METLPDLISICKEKGLKLTPQRIAIYRMLSARAKHPTINEIYEEIKKGYPSMSLNTIYKTIQLFIELGMVSQFTSREGVIRYEAKIVPHHHILCLRCRKIHDIFDISLDKLKVTQSLKGGFEVLRHDVIFYGYCRECKAQ